MKYTTISYIGLRLFTVHEAINKTKHGNYKRFAIELQNLEAGVVIFNGLKTL